MANVSLAFGKLAAGILGNSTAMIADAVHSFGDLISDFVTKICLTLAERKPDATHPFGYGKYESLGAAFVAALVTASGCGIGYHSAHLMYTGVEHLSPPAGIALAAAVASIGVKEGLFQVTERVGTKYRSKVTIANAWHHRSDALTSLVALVGIGGAMCGYPMLDPIAGLAVSALVVKSGVEIGNECLADLVDKAVTGPEFDEIGALIAKCEGVLQYHDLRIRRMGPFFSVDVHIVVDPRLSVSAAHQIAEKVRVSLLSQNVSILEVLVHVDCEDDTTTENERTNLNLMRSQDEIREDISKILRERFPVITRETHFTVHYVEHHLTVQLEVCMDPRLTLQEANRIAREVKTVVESEVSDVDLLDIHLELDEDLELPASSPRDDNGSKTSQNSHSSSTANSDEKL